MYGRNNYLFKLSVFSAVISSVNVRSSALVVAPIFLYGAVHITMYILSLIALPLTIAVKILTKSNIKKVLAITLVVLAVLGLVIYGIFKGSKYSELPYISTVDSVSSVHAQTGVPAEDYNLLQEAPYVEFNPDYDRKPADKNFNYEISTPQFLILYFLVGTTTFFILSYINVAKKTWTKVELVVVSGILGFVVTAIIFGIYFGIYARV